MAVGTADAAAEGWKTRPLEVGRNNRHWSLRACTPRSLSDIELARHYETFAARTRAGKRRGGGTASRYSDHTSCKVAVWIH